jgi:antitoxin (DNA-binding transcriptional repressor) of toxin-antitoxin stability system
LIDGTINQRYKIFMKTLTIMDAKKNLSRWLTAAAQGEDIGIICGADVIALRKVDVESTDYAQREYGVTPEQLAVVAEATKSSRRLLRHNSGTCLAKVLSIDPAVLKRLRDPPVYGYIDFDLSREG